MWELFYILSCVEVAQKTEEGKDLENLFGKIAMRNDRARVEYMRNLELEKEWDCEKEGFRTAIPSLAFFVANQFQFSRVLRLHIQEK